MNSAIPTAPIYGTDAGALVRQAMLHPPKYLINDLICEEETVVIHGQQESFKTTLMLMLARSLATGDWFLGRWKVRKPRKVFFVETEMSPASLGQKCAEMWSSIPPQLSANLFFVDKDEDRELKKQSGIESKVGKIKTYAESRKADIVLLDTVNPMFRVKDDPNSEVHAGQLFDCLETINASLRICVRHDHRPRETDSADNPAGSIRGSGIWFDRPDFMWHMVRPDKRTNEARLEISKFRHGSKGDPLELWFDVQQMSLISYPPVLQLLYKESRTRNELIRDFERRFSLGHTQADARLAMAAKDGWINESFDGHNKRFTLNPMVAARFPWYRWFEKSLGECVRDKEPSIKPPHTTT
jgi:hypothetical protein